MDQPLTKLIALGVCTSDCELVASYCIQHGIIFWKKINIVRIISLKAEIKGNRKISEILGVAELEKLSAPAYLNSRKWNWKSFEQQNVIKTFPSKQQWDKDQTICVLLCHA